MMKTGLFLATMAYLLLGVRSLGPSHDAWTHSISKSLVDDSKDLATNAAARRSMTLLRDQFSISSDQGHRSLQPDEDVKRNCDGAFLKCITVDKCARCFAGLEVDGIDWASVTPDTPCDDVTSILFDGGHCQFLRGDTGAMDTFCKTFDSCVVWDGDEDDEDSSDGTLEPSNKTEGNSTIDCDTLTECKWPGIHYAFIGDGACHEGMRGCYNHEVCDFDGGDCCDDTCKKDAGFKYVECGHDGYSCRDPESAFCDAALTDDCELGPPDDNELPVTVDCGPDEALYRLIMYDSFGDGWDDTKLTLGQRNPDREHPVFVESLKDGSQGTELICLNMKPTCYHVDVSGGVWGNEVSWEIKPYGEGTRSVADGGAPMSCDFEIGGSACERTCNGKPNKDVNDDPDYKTYKHMFDCIQKKCVIQVGTCKADDSCKHCFTEYAPEFCFANDNFNAVIDCGLCSCTDDKNTTAFCQKKATPGTVLPPKGPADKDKPRPCSAAETLQGSSALLTFSKCTEFDKVGMIVTDFDENNFGALDTFEACAHSYKKDDLHGGKTALGCMQILSNAIIDPVSGNSTAPKEAISALAGFLYHQAEDFCECASKASAACPLCPKFVNFKTLLYETLDACQALDEIDCDAWNEFYTPCQSNLQQMFGSVDFTNQKQCDYAQDSCGGAGPFPAFRRLDCDREIPQPAWDFYDRYSSSCLNGPAPGPSTTAEPTSVAQPADPVKPNDNNHNSGSDGGSTPRPYVPPDSSSGGKSYTPTEKKRKHRFLKFLVLVGFVGGVVYWYQKRRAESFSFVRYRRARNYGGDGDMYTGLAMDPLGGSTSFEPPTLPPPPSAMEGGMT